MGPLRRTRGSAKARVERGLRAIGSSPEIVAGLADLRRQVAENTENIKQSRVFTEAVSGQIEEIAHEVAALSALVRQEPDCSTAEHDLAKKLSKLSLTIANLAEGFHLQHITVGQLELRIDRLAGAVLDEVAMQRRMEVIEDRLLAQGSTAGQPSEIDPPSSV